METETIQYPKCGDVDRCRIPEESSWYGNRSQLRKSAVYASCAGYSSLGDREFLSHIGQSQWFSSNDSVSVAQKNFSRWRRTRKNGYNKTTQNMASVRVDRIPIDHRHDGDDDDEFLILHSVFRILRSLAIVCTQSHSCLGELLRVRFFAKET